MKYTQECYVCHGKWPTNIDVVPGGGGSVRYVECPECAKNRRFKKFIKIQPSIFADTMASRLPKAQLKQAMAWKYGRKGLALFGPTGVGKTRIVWFLLRRVLVEDQPEVRFKWFKDITFGQELGTRYRNETAEDWLQELAAVDLLFIDDFGKMKLTERAESELFGLIDIRCERGLPVIVTTNETGGTLEEKMTEGRGAPLVRRLREFCETIQF